MNKPKMNYERRVRYCLSVTLLSSLFLLSPTYVHTTAVHGQETMEDEDKDVKTSVIVRVVSELSQEPLIGAVVCCEGVSNPSVTDIDGRRTIELRRAADRLKLTVTYVGYKTVTRVVSVPDSHMITLQLKDNSKQLDNATIMAQRRYTTVLQQLSVISQEALEKGGATSLAKLLETIPGVSSISTGNTITKSVIQGIHSSRILLMNNGVRLESQSWGVDHAPELDYTGSSMVEVVKDTECIRYGFGTMDGMVLLNDASLPYENKKIKVNGNVSMGYDTNARGFSGSGTTETGYKQFGLCPHGMYTKGGDYHAVDYVLSNTRYNIISFSALAGWQGKKLMATLFSSIYYQRSGIYHANKVSDLSQLIKRFEYGRPDPETVKPSSYETKPPSQQSQYVTLKDELKWELNLNYYLNFTLSFQKNLRQELENRKKTQWSWTPMQNLMLKTYKFDAFW